MIRIRELREARKLLQEDLGKYLNVGKNTISRYERGEREPDLKTLVKLADFFEVTIDEILGRSSYTHPVLNNASGEDIAIFSKYLQLSEAHKKVIAYAFKMEFDRLQEATLSTEVQRKLPVYLDPATAGSGKFIEGNDYSLVEVDREVPLDAHFGVVINDGCMEPDYPEGHVAWVKMQPQIELGQIGLFIVDSSAYIRRYRLNILQSMNEGCGEIKLQGLTNMRTVGLVVGVSEIK